ncbi:MAG TPA: aminopeptidase, partial [Ramlibacter sp.]|nr:aminopeptidase [Ramlibacter sp.]
MQKMISTLVATTTLAIALPAGAADKAAATVQEAPLRAHLEFLSSDLLEGRGTGQRGGDLTVAYLEAQSKAIGLKPGNGNSYRQSVKIAGVKAKPQESTLSLQAAGAALPLTYGADWVWGPGDAKEARSFDHQLVFAGYGITAPEEGWNDYAGLDCTNKVLVV